MAAKKNDKPLAPETLCVHAGGHPDSAWHSLSTPIYMTSTFRLEDSGLKGKYFYTRMSNPTRTALEDTLAAIEGGARAVATGAGVAAEATVMHLFATGTHVVSGNDIYGGTHHLFVKHMAPMGFSFTFVDMRDPKNVERAIKPETKLIWIETPSNPLLNLVDIAAVAAVARKRGILTVVDSTFASPVFQQPLALGADISLHSTTKYLNGHSDVVGGAVIAKTKELGERLAGTAASLGTTCSPFDAFLVLRGVKTLPIRMRAHAAGAMALARFLEKRRDVERVYFPGLESHPQHALARRQMTGFGGMLSFDLKGGQAAVFALFRKLQLFQPAASLGGVESLIEHPATLSHAPMTPAERAEAGISDGCVRVSVGIENPDDLIRDMEQALDAVR